MSTALYAGSFDPLTSGHLDIAESGIKIFDKVIIAVAYNPEKHGFLTADERVELIKQCVKDLPNIEVYSYDGLTTDFAKKHNANVLLRGVRNSVDYEYEKQLAQINLGLAPEITTVFLSAKPEHSHISSSAVRELISHKCDLSDYVPDAVNKYIVSRFYS